MWQDTPVTVFTYCQLSILNRTTGKPVATLSCVTSLTEVSISYCRISAFTCPPKLYDATKMNKPVVVRPVKIVAWY